MAYYIDLFSPETYSAFGASKRDVSGFRERHENLASSIKPGDKLICYMTKLSRWVGILTVSSPSFIDNTPIFMESNDPFTIRFKVTSDVWLSPENAIPINDDVCWKHLSFTKKLPKGSLSWTGMVRGSLRKLEDADGVYLESILIKQSQHPTTYALSDIDNKKLKPSVINTAGSQVVVSIPDDDKIQGETKRQLKSEQRESIELQAKLAQIGEEMNFQIWLPRSDRQRVLEIWKPTQNPCLLEQLPFNYNDVTMRTIENIDVLWIRKRTVIRAFEVEHTTSIYSGILRMADLLALQPNLSIKSHIVAPTERRQKVLQEIGRPVFALLESGPLSGMCSYISYDSIAELSSNRDLKYMTDDVLEKYEEYAEDVDV